MDNYTFDVGSLIMLFIFFLKRAPNVCAPYINNVAQYFCRLNYEFYLFKLYGDHDLNSHALRYSDPIYCTICETLLMRN